MNSSDIEKAYWQGRRDGTAILADKERELVAKTQEATDLSVVVDDLRAQLRVVQQPSLGSHAADLAELRIVARKLEEAEEELEAMRVTDPTELAAQVLELKRQLKAMQSGERMCWHCYDVLNSNPDHCEKCPAFDQCDEEGCSEPGCQE